MRTLQFLINGKEIDRMSVKSFYLHSSIYSEYPTGQITVKDNSGYYLSTGNLAVGTVIKVRITDDDSSASLYSSPVSFCDLVITGILDGIEIDPINLSGYLVIDFAYPLALYLDSANHAYAPMSVSKLIQKVIAEGSRGYKISAETKNFQQTDDSGTLPRYKTNTSDWKFITDYLVPLSVSGSMPCYFFIDEYGVPKLSNYSNLLSNTETCLILPSLATATTDSASVMSLASARGIKDEAIVYSFDASMKIRSNTDLLKRKVIMEDYLTRRIYSGSIRPVTKMNKNSGSVIGANMPVEEFFDWKCDSTSLETYANRNLEDATALSLSRLKPLDSFFALSVSCGFLGNSVRTGGTAFMYYPNIPKDESMSGSAKSHWASGKWLVSEVYHTFDTKPETHLMLVRPTYIVTKGKTTLDRVESLMSVRA